MGLLDKFRGAFGPGEEGYSQQEEYGYDTAEAGYEGEYYDEEPPKTQRAVVSSASNKFVNINATTQLKVVLVKPERFDDAAGIADHLNERRTVVLNLESTNKEVARRLVDFLSGVAYANSGDIKRVAQHTFLITPYNVDIVGENLLDELENNGMF